MFADVDAEIAFFAAVSPYLFLYSEIQNDAQNQGKKFKTLYQPIFGSNDDGESRIQIEQETGRQMQGWFSIRYSSHQNKPRFYARIKLLSGQNGKNKTLKAENKKIRKITFMNMNQITRSEDDVLREAISCLYNPSTHFKFQCNLLEDDRSLPNRCDLKIRRAPWKRYRRITRGK